ncbi:MAG: FecR family protein, partial [Bacteroidota bacterium]
MNNNEEQVIVNDSIIDLSQKIEFRKTEAKMNEVSIPFGKKSELLLADGTKVWLNAGSRLAFPTKFTGKKREIFLEGEACFEVAHNSEQPFIVNAGGLDIKVLGTNFNVSAYPTEKTVETVLVEGSVAVSRPKTFKLGKKELTLKPNQKASFDKENNEVILTDEPDVDLYIAWTYGWLRYERESLESVLRKVERYYNVEIELPAGYPSDDKISGKLDLENSLETVMGFLSDATGSDFRIAGNKVVIDEKLEKLPTR